MAVYTQIGAEEMAALVNEFDVGELVSAKGIAEGVSNSNWLLETTGRDGSGARFILTMYEFRIELEDLPYFLSLLDHLAAKGCPVPRTIHDRDGALFRRRGDKALALIEFLPGVSVSEPTVAQARSVGAALAQIHAASADFAGSRKNGMGLAEWQRLFEECGSEGLASIDPELAGLVAEHLPKIAAAWPQNLPRAVIHADLFPDNVLMLGDKVTGLIDFYFACNDLMAYDVAVTHAAWCFDGTGRTFRPDLSQALLEGYESVRALSAAERAALPLLAQGAAMRFTSSRAYDWLNTPADALVVRKDPLAFARRLQFYAANPAIFDKGALRVKHVEIFTDGACKGNPGKGGWGALLRMGEHEKEMSGSEKETTNNRMELMGAIMALQALKQPCRVTLHTDSKYVLDGITKWVFGWQKKGWKTADNKPVKNEDLWRALVDAVRPHKVEWVWVKGHDGHPENERADKLASDAAIAA